MLAKEPLALRANEYGGASRALLPPRKGSGRTGVPPVLLPVHRPRPAASGFSGGPGLDVCLRTFVQVRPTPRRARPALPKRSNRPVRPQMTLALAFLLLLPDRSGGRRRG